MKPRESTRVILVNADTDSFETASSAACFPPLGLLTLGTSVQKLVPDNEIVILDQATTPFADIVSRFERGSVVGISTLSTTYNNALSLARAAREVGCFVVMGNDHASRFARKIVEKREVDAVLVGDCVDLSFAELVKRFRWNKSLEGIPGVVFRWQDATHEFPPTRYPLEMVMMADRTLIDHGIYGINFRKQFPMLARHKGVMPTTSNLCKGCARFNNRCSFCDIYDLLLDRVSVERAWKEWTYLQSLGLTYIWEVGDSFTSHRRWLEELARRKPDDFNAELFVYARAQELRTLSTVKILKEIGVTRVNVGMESGNNDALQFFNKGNKDGNTANIEAAENLASEGLKAHISLILGWPGETEASLDQTVELVAELLACGILTSLDPSILYPLPGAPLWSLLRDCSEFDDVVDSDIMPPNLRERFLEKFCEVPIEKLHDYCSLLNRMASEAGCTPGGFG